MSEFANQNLNQNEPFFTVNDTTDKCVLESVDDSVEGAVGDLDMFLKRKTEAQKVTQEKFLTKQDELIRLSCQRNTDSGKNFHSEPKEDPMLIQNNNKDSKETLPGYSYNINEIRDYNKVRQLMKKEKMSHEDQSQSQSQSQQSHYTNEQRNTFLTGDQNPENEDPHDWADNFLTGQHQNQHQNQPNPPQSHPENQDPNYPYSDFSHSYVNKQFGSKESSPPDENPNKGYTDINERLDRLELQGDSEA